MVEAFIGVPEQAKQLREALKGDLDPGIRAAIEDALGAKAEGWATSYLQGGMVNKAYQMLTGERPVGSVRPDL
ncbi:MAG: hypothetical protein PHH13_01965 [Candidatus Peribacteraceae bacterium]|nr:hypothetical protein [Candidatus Peribacteraceae bacterium]